MPFSIYPKATQPASETNHLELVVLTLNLATQLLQLLLERDLLAEFVPARVLLLLQLVATLLVLDTLAFVTFHLGKEIRTALV